MIRFAEERDIERIMSFIDTYWKKGHIMGRDRTLFEFQHKWGNEISFVLSEADGEINGILGFIPYKSHNRDITLAIWKVIKSDNPILGINILSYLREHGNINSISAPGINKKTIAIYDFLGMNTGLMKQWYRLAKNDTYSIALVDDNFIPPVSMDITPEIYELDSFEYAVQTFGLEECLKREHQLEKSLPFIKRRYYRHPYFKYLKYGIKHESSRLFVVLRVQPYDGAAVLRVIDCIGDHGLFRYFTPTLDGLMAELGCEYSDCYETGIADDVFADGGWRLVKGSGNIMPDYFAPFEQRNIDIYYMSEIDNAILFKGDGDMDRPN